MHDKPRARERPVECIPQRDTDARASAHPDEWPGNARRPIALGERGHDERRGPPVAVGIPAPHARGEHQVECSASGVPGSQAVVIRARNGHRRRGPSVAARGRRTRARHCEEREHGATPKAGRKSLGGSCHVPPPEVRCDDGTVAGPKRQDFPGPHRQSGSRHPSSMGACHLNRPKRGLVKKCANAASATTCFSCLVEGFGFAVTAPDAARRATDGGDALRE